MCIRDRSSIGSTEIREQDKALMKKALEEFSYISVRETFAKQQLEKIMNRNINVVCDPTFLLTGEEWRLFAKQYSDYLENDQKYILTYFVSLEKYSEHCINLVKTYSESLGLPVWAVQFTRYYSKNCDKKILGASIADMIRLIEHAELIITDSFHGVALSVNLGKNFVAVENRGNPYRTRNLLSRLNLLDRIDMDIENYSKVDYSNVTVLLNDFRKESVDWFCEAIEN